MEKRVDDTETEVKAMITAVGEVSVVKEKLIGLDRLMATQLDEIKHTLRRLEERSFDPGTPSGRKRSVVT